MYKQLVKKFLQENELTEITKFAEETEIEKKLERRIEKMWLDIKRLEIYRYNTQLLR